MGKGWSLFAFRMNASKTIILYYVTNASNSIELITGKQESNISHVPSNQSYKKNTMPISNKSSMTCTMISIENCRNHS